MDIIVKVCLQDKNGVLINEQRTHTLSANCRIKELLQQLAEYYPNADFQTVYQLWYFLNGRTASAEDILHEQDMVIVMQMLDGG